MVRAGLLLALYLAAPLRAAEPLVTSLSRWRTSADETMAACDAIVVSDGTAVIGLPARSISTLVGSVQAGNQRQQIKETP